MKMVINISEEFYDGLLDESYDSIRNIPLEHTVLVLKIKNGKPLDDVFDEIRTEIEEYRSTIDNAISEDELKIKGMKEAYTDCLEIIDKYKTESEE